MGRMNTETRPEQFHRIERTRWRALCEAALLAVLFWVFSLSAVTLLGITGVLLGLPETMMNLEEEDLDANVLLLTSLALTCAAPLLAARIVGRDPARLLSVERRFRLRPALIAAGVAAAGYAVVEILGQFLWYDTAPVLTARGLAFILVCVLVIPIQAAAEELVFRAAIPQIVGTWVRSPLVAYAAGAVFFVLGHGYNWIGLIDITVFALCAAYLTWATRGIEAATALHAVGNILAFSGLGLGINNPTQTDVSPWVAVQGCIESIVFTALIVWALRRWGVDTQRAV